jgi:Tfp pilus assembly protein PilW
MRLVDLLVSIAVSALLLGGVAALLHQGQQAYALGVARVEAQQGVRLALERMAAEVRDAGWSPGGTGVSAVDVAEPTQLTIQHDLDGDGVIAGAGERITYLLRDATLRRDAGGGAQPLLPGVRGLAFTYLDADRNVTSDPLAVRSVIISLSAGPTRPWGRGPQLPVVSATTEIRLRNR